ncbi:unnamed protein product, partial [Iphiclides podalirius]
MERLGVDCTSFLFGIRITRDLISLVVWELNLLDENITIFGGIPYRNGGSRYYGRDRFLADIGSTDEPNR